MKKILVAGIGNKLMGDDGFGPRVAELLSLIELPENVEAQDFGTASFVLASDLGDYDFVIFVDAVQRGGKAGDLYIFELNASDIDIDASAPVAFSLHEAGVEEMLIFAKKIGSLPEKIVIIGCEPGVLEIKLGLSIEVEEAAKKAVEVVLKKVREKINS